MTTRSMLRVAVLVLMVVSTSASLSAAERYQSGGSWIDLEPANDEVAVIFDSQVPDTVYNAMVSDLETTTGARVRRVDRLRVVTLPVNDAGGRGIIGTWASSEGAEVVPVFLTGAGRLVAIGEVVVRFRLGLDPAKVEAVHRRMGTTSLRTLGIPGERIDIVAGADPFALAAAYLDDPLVEFAHPNFLRFTKRCTTPNDPLFPNQWALNNTGQSGGTPDADMDVLEAWGLASGTGEVIIAIVDEGVDLTHLDLEAKLVPGYDATDGDENPTPNPWDAHGTACAGIASATTNNALGIAGVSWGARIMPIRIAYTVAPNPPPPLPPEPWVYTDEWVATGLIEAVVRGADILSNSWGGGDPSDLITFAIRFAHNNGRDGRGCVVVFASGNDNGPVIYPGQLPEAICVGATNADDDRCTPDDWGQGQGSNFGPELDVVAPGNQIVTTDIMGADGYSSGDYVTGFAGTSAATPHVAGVAALLLSVRPDLTCDEVQAMLQSAADDQVGDPAEDLPGLDQFMGWGRVNAYTALSALGPVFEIEVIDSGPVVGRYCSASMDETGRLAVVYYNDSTGALRYAVKDGTWQIETLDDAGDVGQYAALTIDDSGRRSISYYDATFGAVKYAGWATPGWTTVLETVDPGPGVGMHSSLDLDQAGRLAVGYHDQSTGALRYAVKDGTWQIETLDDAGDVGQYAALTIDDSGRRSISYYDATFGAVKYAGWATPGWTTVLETVDPGPGVGMHSSLDLDQAGRLAVGYYDQSTGALRYAVKDGTWQIETLDDAGDVGQYAALTIDDSGRRSISYYDATFGAVKYAGWATPGWTTVLETVDPGPGVGMHSSLDLDQAGRLAVGYYDHATGALRYALRDGNWEIQTIEELGDLGQYASLAIDDSGRRSISYYDATSGAVKYAGWLVPPWHSVVEIVDSGPGVGEHSSLTRDGLNRLVVAYYQAVGGNLRYAFRHPANTWQVETVDDMGDVGRYASLAVDRTNQVHISYYDASNTALKYSSRYGTLYHGLVQGNIFHDLDGNGLFTAGVDSTISGALVQTQLDQSALTNSAGDYSLAGLQPGSGYDIAAQAAGFYPSTATNIDVPQQGAVTVDFPLTWLGFGTSIAGMAVDPNPTVSVVQDGGVAHRYYITTDNDAGSVAFTAVDVERNGEFYRTYISDHRAVVDVAIPSADIGDGRPGGSATFEITGVGGEPLPAEDTIPFGCSVEARRSSKMWEYDRFGRVSVSFFQVEGGGGVQTTLKETESALAGPDSIAIQRQSRAGAGVEYSVGGPIQVAIGDLSPGAVAASAEGLLSVVTNDRYEFDWRDGNDQTAIAEFLLHGTSNASLLDNTLIRLVGFLEDGFTSGTLNEAYRSDAIAIDLRGSAELACGLGVGAARGLFIGANFEVGAGGHETYEHRSIASPPSERVSLGSTVEVRGSSSLGFLFNQPMSGPGQRLRTKAGLTEEWSGTWGGECAAIYAPGIGDPIGVEVISVSRAVQGGGVTEDRFVFLADTPEAVQAYQVLSEPVVAALLVPLAVPFAAVAGPGIFGPALLEGAAVLADLPVAPRVGYEKVRRYESHSDGFEFSVKLSATGEQTISVGVGGEWGFREGREAVIERGCWAGGYFYPLETYDAVPDDIGVTYRQVWEDVDARIPFEYKLAAWVWDVLTPGIAAEPDTFFVGECGSYAVFSDGAIPDSLAQVSAYSWGWWGGSPCAEAADLAREARARHEAVRTQAEASFGMAYGIGGFYQFEPLNAPLRLPSRFVMTYADSDVAGIDEEELGMYIEKKDTHEFVYIGGSVDSGANTVTAEINQLGLFTLAPRLPGREFTLISDVASLPADDVSTAQVGSEAIYNNDGTLVADGTLFTVGSNAGFIITADADTTIDGIQVACAGGSIEFELRSGPIAFEATITARSVFGSARGELTMPFTDIEAPSAPSNIDVQYVGGTEQLSARWTMNPESDVAGYKIYFDDDQSGPPYTGQVAVTGLPSPIDVMSDTTVVVTGLRGGTVYYVAVTAYDVAGNEGPYSVEVVTDPTAVEGSDALVRSFSVGQNVPNPFNPTTMIQYALPEAVQVRICVYDALGRVVKILVNERREPGLHEVTWDATNNSGHRVVSGIYFYRVDAGKSTEVKKMVLLR